jgi:hypothetical protein
MLAFVALLVAIAIVVPVDRRVLSGVKLAINGVECYASSATPYKVQCICC